MNKLAPVTPRALDLAREVLNVEAAAVQAIATRLDVPVMPRYKDRNIHQTIDIELLLVPLLGVVGI